MESRDRNRAEDALKGNEKTGEKRKWKVKACTTVKLSTGETNRMHHPNSILAEIKTGTSPFPSGSNNAAPPHETAAFLCFLLTYGSL